MSRQNILLSMVVVVVIIVIIIIIITKTIIIIIVKNKIKIKTIITIIIDEKKKGTEGSLHRSAGHFSDQLTPMRCSYHTDSAINAQTLYLASTSNKCSIWYI